MEFTIKGEIRRQGNALLAAAIGFAAVAVLLAVIPMAILGGYESSLLGFFITAAFPAAIAAFVFWKWSSLNSNPGNHPLEVFVKAQGFAAGTAIENDLSTGAQYLSFIAGRDWLLKKNGFSCELFRLADVMWAYEMETANHGMVYSYLIVQLRSGKKLTGTPADSKKNEAFVAELAVRAPWAIVGENPQLHKLWKHDRQGFIAQVDNRKRVLAQGQIKTEG